MGQSFDDIPQNLQTWILQQHIFWVASAPLDKDTHVNVSPKGLAESFHIVNSNKVWYEDITGSGIETIAHLKENGRITLMFCAFDGPPRIVRLFGKGTAHEFGSPEYERLLPDNIRRPGSRAAIVVDVHRVGSSCGYGVPFYAFTSHRTQLLNSFSKREAADTEARTQIYDQTNSNTHAHAHHQITTHNTNQPSDTIITLKNEFPTTPSPNEVSAPAPNGILAYWSTTNAKSIDGLPGIQTANQSTKPFVSQPPGDLTASANVVSGGSSNSAPTKDARDHWWFEKLGVKPEEMRAFTLGALVAVAAVKVYVRLGGNHLR